MYIIHMIVKGGLRGDCSPAGALCALEVPGVTVLYIASTLAGAAPSPPRQRGPQPAPCMTPLVPDAPR